MQRAQDRARGPERTEREARRSNRAPRARSNLRVERATRTCPRSRPIFYNICIIYYNTIIIYYNGILIKNNILNIKNFKRK